MLNDAELKRVLAVVSQGKHAQRNRFAILLSHYAGLRVSEMTALTWSMLIDSHGDVVSSFRLLGEHTKTGESRTVHVSAKLAKEVLAYRAALSVEPKPQAAIISSQKGGAFSSNSLCQLLGRIYANAGLAGASSHSGRRWFITRLAHAGVSPKVIMSLAGHRSLATTQRYIEVNDELMAAAVEIL